MRSGVDNPYGFTVFREDGEEIVIFVYPTQEACVSAAKHIGLALEGAVSVQPCRMDWLHPHLANH
jgi:hypothetical protein